MDGLTKELWEAAEAYERRVVNGSITAEGSRIAAIVRRKREAERKPRFEKIPRHAGKRRFDVWDSRELGYVACDLDDSQAYRIIEALSEKEGRWL